MFKKKYQRIFFIMFYLSYFAYPAFSQAQMQFNITEDIKTEFATYHPFPAVFNPQISLFTIKPDLSDVQYLPPISPEDLNMLKNNHFTVRKSEFTQIYDVYNAATLGSYPVFITSDAVLHAYHVLYDRFLMKTESNKFYSSLNELTDSLLNKTYYLYKNEETLDIKEALFRNLAFFSVAKKLLSVDSIAVYDEVKDLVNEEIQLINQHKGFSYSPILGNFSQLDYSQFQIRGHYTKSDTLSAYFKTMMWYGWTIFTMEPDLFGNLSLTHTLQALLNVKIIYSDEELLNLWKAVYEPTVFFAGKTDDPNLKDYKKIADEIYGENFVELSPQSIANTELLNSFIEKAKMLAEPKIPNYIYGSTGVYKGFRFMGQRFIPDSYMFSGLVSPSAGSRFFPKGLDLMYVLGSERAYSILDSVYNETENAAYVSKLNQFRTEFNNKSGEEWVQNLYWNWLYCLMPLLYEKNSGYPYFMQNVAWMDKELLTALASWAELRHDTILYGKQSSTPRTSLPETAPGYIEPNPYLYARLASLVKYTKDGLQSFNLMDEDFLKSTQLLEDYLLFLRDASIKELEEIPLSEQDYKNILSFGSILSQLVNDPDDKTGKDKMPVVADVHTDQNTNRCLEEAVGYPLEILVIVNEGGVKRLARGVVFSYYEFTQPIETRLTDEAWFEMLNNTPPDLPDWFESFMDLNASQPAYLQDEVPNLFGNKFNYTVSVDPNLSSIPEIFALSQNYPNPFNPSTIIRYSLPAGRQELPMNNMVTLKIYNMLGQEVSTLVNKEQPAGNYEVKFDAGNLASGVYLYRLQAGEFSSVKKLVLLK